MLERRKGRRGSWVLGEIKGKGTHHGSLTDFRVVMFVATVHKVICIAKCGEYSALHALTHLPYTGGSFVTSYFFCCQFVLKSYHPVIQPETSPILNPLLDTVRASPYLLSPFHPSVVVFQSRLFVYIIFYMHSLLIQNFIKNKFGKRLLKGRM
jgi:hypothetical protein